MEALSIHAKIRKSEEKLSEIRKNKYIPGIVYGYKSKNFSVKADSADFYKILEKAGESTLVDLVIDDKKEGKVVINDYQIDPVSDRIIHFDLHKIRMDKELIVNVSIKFTGESPAVKNKGGVLIKSRDNLEIKCLPQYLIHDVEVDLSALKDLNDILRIEELNIPDNVKILSNPEDVVVTVSPPRVEKEEKDTSKEETEKVKDIESVKDKNEKEESLQEEK